MSKISDLYRERNRQVDRASDAEDRGFEGTAKAAREAAGRADREIRKAQATERQGTWNSPAHP